MILIIAILILTYVAFKMKSYKKRLKYPPGLLTFPVVGSIFSLGKKPHEKLAQLKNKYGNVVAVDFGNYCGIVLNDLDVIKEAYSHKEIQCRPDMEASVVVRGKNLPGILFSSGKTNEEQRAFALKTLKTFGMGKKSIEILLHEGMQRLFETFDKQVEIPIVNQGLFQLTAISALWSIMTRECVTADDPKFMDMMENVRKQGYSFNIFTMFLPGISKLFPNLSGWKTLSQSGIDIYNYVGKTILTHKNTFQVDEEPKDFVEAYLKKIESTNDEKSTFFGKTGDENLQSVLADFVIAGTETISTSLTWFLAVAIYHPKVQEKIQSEVDKVVGTNRLPSIEDRKQLPYIESVVYETLRYSAPAPLGLPHVTAEDVKIETYVIPKGTVVLANSYEALHDPKRWDEPETFKPERFLNHDGTAIDRNISRNVDMIFGYGKRLCPGEALAKDELFLFIAGLCQRYTFKRDPQFKYGEKIESNLGVTLVPVPYSLIINKRLKIDNK